MEHDDKLLKMKEKRNKEHLEEEKKRPNSSR